MKARKLVAVETPVGKLKPHPRNYRHHPAEQLKHIVESIRQHGFYRNVVAAKDGTILAGHGVVLAAKQLKLATVPVVRLEVGPNDKRALRLLAGDNEIANGAENDEALLAKLLGEFSADELLGTGFDEAGVDALLREIRDRESATGVSLSERFLIPPFSVLDARQGAWRERKDAWLALGIESEVGRGDNLLKFSETVKLKKAKGLLKRGAADPGHEGDSQPGRGQTGTSIFDPVLCELIYRWFGKPSFSVLDPFAGGSVRGIVAAKLGLSYLGCELREEQVKANNEQASKILASADDHLCSWVAGDSRETLPKLKSGPFDLVLSCPPYMDLEVYSDDPADLSNMPPADFEKAYRQIVTASVERLKPNRFAVFVVGEVRDHDQGFYRNFVPLTIDAFEAAGARFYNEAILVTSVGSLSMRVGTFFPKARKLGKTHQNVLVFFKGDPATIVEELGELEIPPEALELGEATEYGRELP